MLSGGGLQVTLGACPSAARLGPEWETLESQGTASFFSSWTWIGTWLRGLDQQRSPQLLRATLGTETVGLALLVPRKTRRLRILPSMGLHLNATGDPQADDLCIEHNGLLVRQDRHEDISAAMLGHLFGSGHRWDQLHLRGLSTTPTALAVLPSRWVLRQESEKAYLVALDTVRSRDGNFLGWLSTSTRSQIRRSLKAYEALGPVATSAARDTPQALQFLDRLKALHQHTWQSRGAPGAFANPGFEAHHTEIIRRGFDRAEVQMLRVHAGERDIGYLYNFVYRGRVICYQSGFDYGLVQRTHSPGLTAHALAVQQWADSDMHTYDFLAGDARYKRELATDAYPMVNLTVHKPSVSVLLEECWRHFKGRAPLQGTVRELA